MAIARRPVDKLNDWSWFPSSTWSGDRFQAPPSTPMCYGREGAAVFPTRAGGGFGSSFRRRGSLLGTGAPVTRRPLDERAQVSSFPSSPWWGERFQAPSTTPRCYGREGASVFPSRVCSSHLTGNHPATRERMCFCIYIFKCFEHKTTLKLSGCTLAC